MKRFVVLFICVAGLAGRLNTQDQFSYSTAAEKDFAKAVQFFKQQNYTNALEIFEMLVMQKPFHQRTTAAYLMAGKTLQQLKRYKESALLLLNFLKSYPESNYAGDAHYTLAADYMVLQSYYDAAMHSLQSIETTTDQHLSSKASSLFETLSDEHLSIQNLEQLLSVTVKMEPRNLVTLKLAEKYYGAGKPSEADKILEDVIIQREQTPYDKRIRALREKLQGGINLKIGVLLPLHSATQQISVKSIADDVLDGITLALNEFRKQSKYYGTVTLEVRDTGRDSVEAVKVVKELARDKEIVGIIGPLFSNITMACAPIANKYEVPLITPTATADAIAGIGHYIFQASPNLTIRGKAMALYAVQVLGFRKLAVLASADQNCQVQAKSFVQEVKKLGAEIIAAELYPKDASDLHEQFINIRTAGLKHNGQPDSPEKLDVPVTMIQGLFIPISDPEEIEIVSSQVKYFNIKTQVLGNVEWYDVEELDAHKRDVNGVIFAADSYFDKNDSAYIKFNQSYLSQFKKQSTKYSLYGYDVVKLILKSIQLGATSREKLSSALSRVRQFEGLHSKITLVNGRVNSEIQILEYKNGEVKKINEISIK